MSTLLPERTRLAAAKASVRSLEIKASSYVKDRDKRGVDAIADDAESEDADDTSPPVGPETDAETATGDETIQIPKPVHRRRPQSSQRSKRGPDPYHQKAAFVSVLADTPKLGLFSENYGKK